MRGASGAGAAASGGVFRCDLAFPFRIQQVFDVPHLVGLHVILIDDHVAVDASEHQQQKFLLRIGERDHAALPLRRIGHFRQDQHRLQRIDHLLGIEHRDAGPAVRHEDVNRINPGSALGAHLADRRAGLTGDVFDLDAVTFGEFRDDLVAHGRRGLAEHHDRAFFLRGGDGFIPVLLPVRGLRLRGRRDRKQRKYGCKPAGSRHLQSSPGALCGINSGYPARTGWSEFHAQAPVS